MSALVDNKTLLGVEIELERSDLMVAPKLLGKHWRMEGDGSLRLNGAEIVFREPLRGDDAVEAINIAHKVTSKCLFSQRCGLHVHVDMRDIPKPVAYEFVYLYILFEPLLLGFCGADRESNNFCVPTYTHKQLLARLGRHNTIMDIAEWFAGGDRRYAALNFASYRTHGSFEFRAMRGTADPDVLVPWINMLLCLLVYAKTLPDVMSMIKRCSADIGNMILNEVFGEELADLLYQANEEGFNDKLLSGSRALQYVLQSDKATNTTCKLVGNLPVVVPEKKARTKKEQVVWDDPTEFAEAAARRIVDDF